MDRVGEEAVPRNDVIKSYGHAFHIVVRVAGSMMDVHTVLVTESRYDRVFEKAELALSKTTVVLAEQHPPGKLHTLQDRVQTVKDMCPKENGMTTSVSLDVTRSPYLGSEFKGDPDIIQLTSQANDKFLGGTRYLGRLLLLSALSTRIRDRRISFRLPIEAIAPSVGAGEFDRALNTVQAKLPQIEVEEAMLSETGRDDDLALCLGMASFFAAEHYPDPLYRPDDRPFLQKVKIGPDTSWVV